MHRVELSKIRQDNGESIAHFAIVSRLKAKTSLCAFTVVAEAPGHISYEDDMGYAATNAGKSTEARQLPTFKDKYYALVTMHTADMPTS